MGGTVQKQRLDGMECVGGRGEDDVLEIWRAKEIGEVRKNNRRRRLVGTHSYLHPIVSCARRSSAEQRTPGEIIHTPLTDSTKRLREKRPAVASTIVAVAYSRFGLTQPLA